jgi:hypothetical protein
VAVAEKFSQSKGDDMVLITPTFTDPLYKNEKYMLGFGISTSLQKNFTIKASCFLLTECGSEYLQGSTTFVHQGKFNLFTKSLLLSDKHVDETVKCTLKLE